MEVSNHLSQEMLIKIMKHAYQKGNLERDLKSKELINDIKLNILQNCNTYIDAKFINKGE